MHSPGINDEGELRGQLANSGSPGKVAVKTECVCVYVVCDLMAVFCGLRDKLSCIELRQQLGITNIAKVVQRNRLRWHGRVFKKG